MSRSKRKSNHKPQPPTRIVVIEQENPQQCDLCGKIAELRPYGPNGEAICFDCGQKNPEAIVTAMQRRLKGEKPHGRDRTIRH